MVTKPALSHFQHHTFDLFVRQLSDEQAVVELRTPNHNATGVAAFPFTAPELRQSRFIPPDTNQPPTLRHTLRQTGQRIFDFLIAHHPDILTAYNQTLSQPDHGLILQLHLDNTPHLHNIPWELLCDHEGNHLALSRRTSLIRSFTGLQPRPPVPITQNLNILVIHPSPPNYPPLKPLNIPSQTGIAFTPLKPPTWHQLRRLLRTADNHIIHVVAHTHFDQQTASVQLVFEDDGLASGSRPIDFHQIAAEIGHSGTPRLVSLFLENPSPTIATLAAQSLLRTGVSAVIANTAPLSASLHLLIAARLYSSLAAFQPLDQAVTAVRQTIADQSTSSAWASLILFSRARKQMLFRSAAPAAE